MDNSKGLNDNLMQVEDKLGTGWILRRLVRKKCKSVQRPSSDIYLCYVPWRGNEVKNVVKIVQKNHTTTDTNRFHF